MYMITDIPKLTIIRDPEMGELGTKPPIRNTVIRILAKSRNNLAVFSLCLGFILLLSITNRSGPE